MRLRIYLDCVAGVGEGQQVRTEMLRKMKMKMRKMRMKTKRMMIRRMTTTPVLMHLHHVVLSLNIMQWPATKMVSQHIS